MATRAGVGRSEKTNSVEAATEAASAAVSQMGGGRTDLVIVYNTAKHDAKQVHQGLRSVVGPKARIVGGASMGIITAQKVSYGGYELGVAVLGSDTMKVDTFIESGLPDNEAGVGGGLGKQLRDTEFSGTPNVVLMFDSVKKAPVGGMPQLNIGSTFLQGVGTSIGTWPTTVGHGMIGDSSFSPTSQIFDDRVAQNSAMALVLSGGVQMHVDVSHGCKPQGGYYTVTKAQGNVVFELDGKPALDVVTGLLGPDAGEVEQYPMFVTLGRNRGDKFGEFREEDYASRPLMAVLREPKALVMWETDLQAGTEVQLMRRSIDFDKVAARWSALCDKVKDRKPFLALYIDCAGRASMFANTQREEAEEAMKVVGSKMPLLGVYSGCELARIGKDMMSLAWTGVMAIFTES